MTDQQVAEMVNYVRTNFGNSYQDAVTPESVNVQRSALERLAPAWCKAVAGQSALATDSHRLHDLFESSHTETRTTCPMLRPCTRIENTTTQ